MTPAEIAVVARCCQSTGSGEALLDLAGRRARPRGAELPFRRGGYSTTISGKTVSFTATAGGTYTFTYQAQDAAGALSGPATVTVTVVAQETITITKAWFTQAGARLKVEGSLSPAQGQTITVVFINSAGTALSTAGTIVTAPSGATTVAWVLDVRGVPLPPGASGVRATSSMGASQSATLTID